MSSTSTTWTTDTNTKSGVVQIYSSNVSILKILGIEGGDSILELFADEGDDNADKWRLWVDASDDDLHFANYTSGAWANLLTIQDGGNVGIGTASPSTALHVQGAGVGVTIASTGTGSNNAYVAFKTDAAGTPRYGAVGHDYSSNVTKLVYGDSFETPNHLCIDSAGKVGINTDSPGATLEIENTSATGVPAVLIDNDDTDQIALSIVAANIDADVVDISAPALTTAIAVDVTANALTTGKVMQLAATGLTDGTLLKTHSVATVTDTGTSNLHYYQMDNDGVGSQTAKGIVLDYNKTGVTASSKTANVTAMHIDMDDNVTNVNAVNMTGLDIDVNFADAAGTTATTGLNVAVAGADTNYAALFSGGFVGIGIAAPLHHLHAETSVDSAYVAKIKNTSSTNSYGLMIDTAANTGSGEYILNCTTGAGTGFFVTSEAKVGIGTDAPIATSPASTLGAEICNTTTADANEGGYLRLSCNDGTVMASGERLGVLEFAGAEDDGGTIVPAAKVQCTATDNWTDQINRGTLSFWTCQGNANMTEKMTILDTGNVGIGTTAPIKSKILNAVGSAFVKGKATFTLTGSIDPTASTTTTGVGTAFLTEVMPGDKLVVSGETRTITAVASNTELTVYAAWTDNADDGSPDCIPALFSVQDSSGNTDFLVSSDGKVTIGDAAADAYPVSTFGVYSTLVNEQGAITCRNDADDADGLGMHIICGTNGAAAGDPTDSIPIRFSDGDGSGLGQINAGDATGAPAFAAGSDARLKKDIVDTNVNGLEIINGFKMRQFGWTELEDKVTELGFVAQECEDVYPLMVSTGPRGYLQISDSVLVPVLVKAIQELTAKVEALENT